MLLSEDVPGVRVGSGLEAMAAGSPNSGDLVRRRLSLPIPVDFRSYHLTPPTLPAELSQIHPAEINPPIGYRHPFWSLWLIELQVTSNTVK